MNAATTITAKATTTTERPSCTKCEGHGYLEERVGGRMAHRTCSLCDGSGQEPTVWAIDPRGVTHAWLCGASWLEGRPALCGLEDGEGNTRLTEFSRKFCPACNAADSEIDFANDVAALEQRIENWGSVAYRRGEPAHEALLARGKVRVLALGLGVESLVSR